VADAPAAALPTTPDAASAVAQSRTGDGAVAGTSIESETPGDSGLFALGAGVERGARAMGYERATGDPIFRPLWI
jgi:hypothetical protein